MAHFLDHPAAVRAGEQLDLSRLEPFLRCHFPDCDGPLTVEQFPSGHSNLTYLLRLGERELVLRRPPFGSKVRTAHDMGREYRVLSKLHPAFPAAPRVLLHSDDATILGAPFYLMEPIHGIILRRDLPPGLPFPAESARRLGESFVNTLVRLHRLDYQAIGLGELGRPEGYLERQVRGWIERYHGSQTHDLPQVDRIESWLRNHLPPSGAATLIHNDFKYDNLVLDPGKITAIIGVLDWEMATVGDPLSDLGTALAYWVDPQDPDELRQIRWGPTTLPGTPARAGIVERYARETGRDVAEMVFYLGFARFKVAVIVQQIYYRYHHGLTRDARFARLCDVTAILMRAALHGMESGAL